MKSPIFNSLLMIGSVAAAYAGIDRLPDRASRPAVIVSINYQPIDLEVAGPFQVAGAWRMSVADRRFTGLSALAIADGRFVALSDNGAVINFDGPEALDPKALIADLVAGPGDFGRKVNRDAESLVRDPQGRGWWVGYEQEHSVWLYDPAFRRAIAHITLDRPNWWPNRGAEGLLAANGKLLVLAESGREALLEDGGGWKRTKMSAGGEVAEAATAPDGSHWLLLRSKGFHGISQWIAPLEVDGAGLRAGTRLQLQADSLDNFEGMAIEQRGTGWRFWLVSDDGHRIMARSLLVALDYDPAANEKSPAQGTGPSGQSR